jgi:hypothetical protein
MTGYGPLAVEAMKQQLLARAREIQAERGCSLLEAIGIVDAETNAAKQHERDIATMSRQERDSFQPRHEDAASGRYR